MNAPQLSATTIQFQNSLTAWWLELLVPIVAALIALVIAAYTYRRSLETQSEEYRKKYQLDLYRDLMQKTSLCSEKLIEFKSQLRFFREWCNHSASENYVDDQNGFFLTYDEIFEAKDIYNESLLNLLSAIEQNRIIEPKLDIYITAIHSSTYDFNLIHPKLISILSYYLRTYSTEEEYFIDKPTRVFQGDIDKINKTLDEVNGILFELTSYIHDLTIEAQNLLLKDLFNNIVPIREPLDPKVIVLNTKNYQELKKHFLENTQWGKDKSAREERLKKTFDVEAPTNG